MDCFVAYAPRNDGRTDLGGFERLIRQPDIIFRQRRRPGFRAHEIIQLGQLDPGRRPLKATPISCSAICTAIELEPGAKYRVSMSEAWLARRLRLFRHCEPTGRANARPMTGSAKQSRRLRTQS